MTEVPVISENSEISSEISENSYFLYPFIHVRIPEGVMCECKLHLSANKKHIYILSYILANILDQYIFWNSDAGGCTPKKTFWIFWILKILKFITKVSWSGWSFKCYITTIGRSLSWIITRIIKSAHWISTYGLALEQSQQTDTG